MKENIIKIGLLFILSLSCYSIAQGQIKKQINANNQFNNYAYSDAIAKYLNIIEKGKANADVYLHLGDAYYFNGQLTKAYPWYEQYFESTNVPTIEGDHYFRFAQTLQSVGKNEQANEILKYWSKNYNSDSPILEYLVLDKDSNAQTDSNVKLKLLDLNSLESDYSAVTLRGKIIFTSSRTQGDNFKEKDSWTNQSFTSLYQSDLDNLNQVELFNLESNSNNINHSSAVFSKDGQTMFFTANNINKKGKKKFNKKNSSLLKIFKAVKLDNGMWGSVEELSINSDDYNTAHPSLSSDEKYLYFSSDRPGGFGQADIYRVELQDLIPIGEVVNLGKQINTKGRETYPYNIGDILYFSSDAHIGYGGLDIFKVDVSNLTSIGNVQNLGPNFNSTFDDFSYFEIDSNRGFISSNRLVDNLNYDNIFLFQLCLTKFSVLVKDMETNQALVQADVKFKGSEQKIFDLKTDQNGQVLTESLLCDQLYDLEVSAKGYKPQNFTITLTDQQPTLQKEVLLQREKQQEPWQSIEFPLVYFDFDKSKPKENSQATLEQVLAILQKYPNLQLDILAHTDSRGSASYNMELSKRRAKSIGDWFIDRGISKDRLRETGYGESQLLNNCIEGVPCTIEQHAQNRRTEFKID